MAHSSDNFAVIYQWPPLPESNVLPVWTGRGFSVADQHSAVLRYASAPSNWTNELTSFHEDVAGDTHPIDRASREHAVSQVKKFVKTVRPIILEVGCSSGFLLRDLRAWNKEAFVIGSDNVSGPLDALASQSPDLPLLQFDLVKCPLPSDSLDAAVLLNVLEHVEAHEEALAQVFRILKPGGVAIIEVPAGPHLYDVYDKQLLHWRRYSMQNLQDVAKAVSFRILRASHLGFFVYPAFVRAKRSGQKILDAPVEEQRAWVAARIQGSKSSFLLRALMRMELALGEWVRYGIGIRCLLTCAKPD